jgi:branched-chain amino acid transport system ATP-binding protein
MQYGGLRVLSDVSLKMQEGRVLAILGANGAGKSSLARAVCGLVPISAGRIVLDGVELSGLSASRIARLGLTYIPEGRGIFRALSVHDNLRIARRLGRYRGVKHDVIEMGLEMFPALRSRMNQRAGSLSGGEQQMLALARTLTVNAKLIIADELSLGLAPIIVDEVFKALSRAKDLGVTLIVIEQFVDRALALADDCVILARGAITWQGPSDLANAAVLEHYLGQPTHESDGEIVSQISS